MRKTDFIWLVLLTAFGAYIWFRDLGWVAAADDLLPIVAGLPLFLWLRWPLRFKAGATAVPVGRVLIAVLLFAGGVLFNSSLVLTASWVLLLWTWLAFRIVDGADRATGRLMVLPFFSFPWIATDFERLGWWFRLSGAAAVERSLAFGNVDVTRNGTFLLVDGFQLSVEPACSGLNGLQSMLIAGTMMAFVVLKRSPLYWSALLLLPLAAWLANFFRILSGAMVGLAFEPAAAARWIGPLHSVAGWLALCAMFGVCWTVFSRLERVDVRGSVSAWARMAPWLEFTLLVFAVWRCHGLLQTWFTSPYDQLGWLAFSLWILPVGLAAQRMGLPAAGSGRGRSWSLAAGVGLLFFGDAGAINAVKYVGLALILIGFAPRTGRTFWAFGALSWMPVLGWVASRLGVDPAATGMVRAVIGMGTCAWWLALQPVERRADESLYAGSIKTTV